MDSQFQLQNLATREILPLDKLPVIVGRHSACDLVIDSNSLSRKHARIGLAADGVVVEDLGSTNGTYINNARVAALTPVAHGDVIAFGKHRYKFIDLKQPVALARISDELVEMLSRYKDDDLTSSKTMEYSPFARSMGVLPEPEDARSESVTQLILDALSATPFDHRCVPAVLIVKNTRRRGALIQLKLPKGGVSEWAVGRSQLADVVLDDPTVSNLHAVIAVAEGKWRINNNSSTNGIKVNHQSLDSGGLGHGDLLSIGGMELIFYLLEHDNTA